MRPRRSMDRLNLSANQDPSRYIMKSLRGRDGKRISIVDSSGKIKEIVAEKEAVDGQDIHLTIDAELQNPYLLHFVRMQVPQRPSTPRPEKSWHWLTARPMIPMLSLLDYRQSSGMSGTTIRINRY